MASTLARVSGAFLEYNFARTDCLQNVFPDISNYSRSLSSNIRNYLVPHDSQSMTCLDGDGVQARLAAVQLPTTTLSSVTEIQELVNLNSSSFTIEFWLRQNASVSSTFTELFTIGDPNGQVGSYSCQYALQVGQYPSTDRFNPSKIILQTCSSDGLSMALVKGALPVTDTIHHIAFTLNYSSVIGYVSAGMYINGQVTQSLKVPLPSDAYLPTMWSPSYALEFFSNSVDTALWPGQFYYSAVYLSALTSIQVQTNYLAGIPDSLPTVRDISTIIKENGEDASSHYDNPAFYLAEVPPVELAVIRLNVFDLDEQTYCTQACRSHIPGTYASLLITSLPSLGSLYFYNGTLMSLASTSIIIPDTVSGQYWIRYRPPWNVHSSDINTPLDQFTYIAVDGSSGQYSASSATVRISIQQVIQPPKTLLHSNATVKAGKLTAVSLGGAVDPQSPKNTTLTAVNIVSLPSQGRLFQLVQNGSSSELEEVVGPCTLSSFQVNYIYDGSSLMLSEEGLVVGNDTFEYEVIDSYGHTSVTAPLTISVVTPLIAWNESTPLAAESSPSVITVYGADESIHQRNLTARVKVAPRHGQLLDMAKNNSLATGSNVSEILTSIEYNNNTGLHISYLSDAYYFNTPSRMWNGTKLDIEAENFTYFWEADDGTRSNAQFLSIIVQNVNNPTDFSFNTSQTIKVYAYSGAPDTVGMSSSVQVYGFRVDDPDRGVEPVHVVVSTSSETGRVTLNRDAIPTLDFSSSSYCSNPHWSCRGDGYSGDLLSFVAQPSDVEAALNGLTYVNTQPNIDDSITVVVYDGEGGDCLWQYQLGDGSIHRGCYVAAVSFSIQVMGFSSILTGRSGSNDLLSVGYVVYALIGLSTIIVLVCARCGYIKYKRMKANIKDYDEKLVKLSPYKDKKRNILSGGKLKATLGTPSTVASSTPRSTMSSINKGTKASKLDYPQSYRSSDLPRPFPTIHLPSDIKRTGLPEPSKMMLQQKLLVPVEEGTKTGTGTGSADRFKQNLARFESRPRESAYKNRRYAKSKKQVLSVTPVRSLLLEEALSARGRQQLSPLRLADPSSVLFVPEQTSEKTNAAMPIPEQHQLDVSLTISGEQPSEALMVSEPLRKPRKPSRSGTREIQQFKL